MVNVVKEVNSQVERINKKISDYKTKITASDDDIFVGDFVTRKYNSTYTFITWKNEEIKDTIWKLFSGKEVYLYAVLMKASSQEWDAVKMKIMKLNVVARKREKKGKKLVEVL